MTAFRFEVRTPNAAVFQREVEQVIAPLPDGWIGIRAGHAPFIARLLPGELSIRDGRKDLLVATRGGVLVVSPGGVTALTGAAAADSTLEGLDETIGQESRQLAALETEAARHFERIYRQMANASRHGGRA